MLREAHRVLTELISEYEKASEKYNEMAREEHERAEREAMKANPKHKRREFRSSAYDWFERRKKEIRTKTIKELSASDPLMIEYEFMHFFGAKYREEMNRLIDEAFTSLCLAKINKILSE